MKKYNRVRTDLEKSLNFTLVLENSWKFKNSAICPGIFLEFCKIALETVKLKMIKYIDSFRIFWIRVMRERKL